MGTNGIIRTALKHAVLLGLLSLIAASAASAQTAEAPKSGLDGVLTPGTKVWITDTSGHQEKTLILGVDGDVVITNAGKGVKRFRTADIMRVEVRHFDSVLNGALIGAASMIATGLSLCTAMEPWETCVSSPGSFVPAAAIGAGIGIGIDALWSGRKTVFDRARGSMRLHAAPIVGRETKGLQLSISF